MAVPLTSAGEAVEGTTRRLGGEVRWGEGEVRRSSGEVRCGEEIHRRGEVRRSSGEVR